MVGAGELYNMRIQSHLNAGVNMRTDSHLAAASLADREALSRLAQHPRGVEIARREKLAPALARAAARDGIVSPATEAWRADLRAAAATRLWLGAAASDLVEAFGAAGIPFAPIKGWDLGRRVYGAPEERPTSDLDLLLPEARLGEALAALAAAGFRNLQEGPRIERYLREEGYAAALKAPAGQLAELHFRLWGSAPVGLAAAILGAASADPELGPTARAIRFEHAYLLAAFHLFLDPPPRPALAFRDLALLAGRGLDRGFLAAETRRFGLDLPVALASAAAAELFACGECAAIAADLRSGLRWPERRLPWDADIPAPRMFLARLLAGRPSRHGWRLLWRRLWPHPGIVETATPAGSAWAARRLWYQWNHWRGRSGPAGPGPGGAG